MYFVKLYSGSLTIDDVFLQYVSKFPFKCSISCITFENQHAKMQRGMFISTFVTKTNQNKPNQTAKNFWSPIQVKFGMLQLAHNSTHHTKFEANWRLFEFLKKTLSFVKFTNNVTAYKSCPKGPSNFGFKFLYKRCVSPSIYSIR